MWLHWISSNRENLRRREASRAFQQKPKAVLFNSPHNPSGRVFTEQELSIIRNLCVKHARSCTRSAESPRRESKTAMTYWGWSERATIGVMKKTISAFVLGLSMLAMVVIKTGGLSAQESRSTGEPAPPRLTFAFELRVRVGNPVEVGQVTHGRRRIVPIEGGTIKGPMLNGTVPAGGADWQTIQADGFTELDTRYMIKTDKGDLVYVQNGGIRTAAPDVMQKLLAGQAVDPKLVYFRTQPKFETAAPNLQWLAKSLFVGVGERYPNEVVIRFFKVE